ncbi:MAG: DUF1592 domain-containing protein [Myxococcota bacterium]
MRWRSSWLCVLCACQGVIGDPATRTPGTNVEAPAPTVTEFACDVDAPSAIPLRRLTTREYQRTLADLFTRVSGEDTASEVLDAAAEALERTPDESLAAEVSSDQGLVEARYARLSQNLSQVRVDNYHDISLAIGHAIAASDGLLERIVGRCAVDSAGDNNSGCIDDFIDAFAPLAFRAPLDPAERAFLRDEAYIDGDEVSKEGLGELIAVILQAPRFLYHFELGTGEGLLEDHELASRLSYHFTGSMPDETLWAAAAAGELQTDAGYEAQVDRLLADPRTQRVVGSFFTEWLGVAELDGLSEGRGSPQFDAFFAEHPPSDSLHDAMVTELVDFTRHTVFEQEGTVSELLSSTASFPRTEELAAIYGVERWSEGDPPIELPASERAGLLTRAAVLARPSVHPHPILRGVFLLRHVLCNELPDPPADVNIPETDPAMSSREFAEVVTEDASCQTCHQSINALGFAFGNYDALGRYITEERLFDEDGVLLDTPPVDATSEIALGERTRVEGGVELSHHLAENDRVQACFTRHVFRFTHRRVESLERDGCALETVRETIHEGGSVLDALRTAALDPAFRSRPQQGGEE